MKKKNFHLPKYWFYMLILSFVILSVMPLMAGFLVNLIANGEEGKIRFLQFNPLFPSLVFSQQYFYQFYHIAGVVV